MFGIFGVIFLAALVKLLPYTSPLVCSICYIIFRLGMNLMNFRHAAQVGLAPILFAAIITGLAAFGYFWIMKKLDEGYPEWMWWVTLLVGASLLTFAGL